MAKAPFDVAIVGGGPSGSTAGSFLKKYRPDLRVAIFERERFPRDHVGESQLPPLSHILDEMGCWDKVEGAGFPIKIGATYRWGKTNELWDFEFMPPKCFKDEPRPAKFDGQRRALAFQVDRATYDDILLEHAASLGCEVFQETKVLKAEVSGDRIQCLALENGSQVEARHYVDASGHPGILRRSLGIKVESPTALQNIAIWKYWNNAEWAVSIGIGGTRVQVLSLGYGWIWFIPLSPTRTSIGVVTSASYFKQTGRDADQLYEEALRSDDLVTDLIRKATAEPALHTTKDWSFIASRMVGENWFLAGESAGFADPILASGLTISQAAAREAAYTIMALEEGCLDATWLKGEFEASQAAQIKTHIRFADYWYSANAQFQDLKEYTAKIAADNGLQMDADKAWAWIARGGFIGLDAKIGTGGFDLRSIKDLAPFMGEVPAKPVLECNNVFRLDLNGATWQEGAMYLDGRIEKVPRYVRGDKVLPIRGAIELLLNVLQAESRMPAILARFRMAQKQFADDPLFQTYILPNLAQSFEAMVLDGWIEASYDPTMPLYPPTPGFNQIKRNVDQVRSAPSNGGVTQ